MYSSRSLLVLGLVGTFTLAGALDNAASADPVAEFYKQTRVRIIQSSAAGGGYDTYARTLARHLPKHIPGKPSVIVQNMPGAGGVVAANFVYNVAPQDGSIVAGLQRSVPMTEIMGHSGPKYDPVKFQWLGSVTNEAGVLAVVKSAKVKTLEDVFKVKAILGKTGPTDTEIYPALMNNTLGAKFELIGGYPSATLIQLAMKRGEVEGVCQSWSSFKLGIGEKFLKENINVVAQMSLKPHPELTKMGVPLIMDIIDRKHVLAKYGIEDAKTWWKLMLTAKAMGRPYAFGPGVAADKVTALRKAFINTTRDPAFVADATKQGRDVSPLSGEEVQQMVADLASAPEATIKQVDDLIKYKGPVRTAAITLAKHTGKVTATRKGGRRIVINHEGREVKAKVSGSRTTVTVDGNKTKRKNIKVGMTCTFTYPGPGQEAKRVDCKN
jgi:tripartite-type tricarboxylate transporter receptor subunit TctC